jgi:hypothetical protein
MRFFFSKTSGLALGRTKPPIQWVLVFFMGVNRPDRHFQLVPKIRIIGAILYSRMCLHGCRRINLLFLMSVVFVAERYHLLSALEIYLGGHKFKEEC